MCSNCDLVTEIVCHRDTSAVRPAREANEDNGIGATTVFRGGTVYTCDPQQPWAQAVAVRGRSIISVGTEDDVLAAAGSVTEVVELQGRMLLPGFVEAHIHPLVGGFLTAGVDLQVSTEAEALAAIADYSRSAPTGPVRGFGWRMDMFGPGGPHRGNLDAILPDRPALLFAIDAHSLWVNSTALRMAGISAETPDPVPGFSFFDRDAAGEPTGFISELPAMLPVIDAIASMTEYLLGQLLADWLPKAAAAGITAVFDAGMPLSGDDPTALADIYTDLEAAGRLPFRVVTSHIVKAPPIETAVAEARRLRDRLGTELVRGGVLKIFGDGTIEGHTAHLLRPVHRPAGFGGAVPVYRGAVAPTGRRGRRRRHRLSHPCDRRPRRAQRARRDRSRDRGQPGLGSSSRHRPPASSSTTLISPVRGVGRDRPSPATGCRSIPSPTSWWSGVASSDNAGCTDPVRYSTTAERWRSGPTGRRPGTPRPIDRSMPSRLR